MSAGFARWLADALNGILGEDIAWVTSTDPVINDHLDHVDNRLMVALEEAIGSVADMLATQPTDTRTLHTYAGLLHLLIAGLQANGAYRRLRTEQPTRS